MRYGTRVTTVENGDGAVLLNGGEPVFLHSVLISSTSGGAPDVHIFEGGVVPGSDSSSIIAHFPIGNQVCFGWYPYALFDKGVLVQEPATSVSITLIWRPDG